MRLSFISKHQCLLIRLSSSAKAQRHTRHVENEGDMPNKSSYGIDLDDEGAVATIVDVLTNAAAG
jgi:hypothetical protein